MDNNDNNKKQKKKNLVKITKIVHYNISSEANTLSTIILLDHQNDLAIFQAHKLHTTAFFLCVCHTMLWPTCWDTRSSRIFGPVTCSCYSHTEVKILGRHYSSAPLTPLERTFYTVTVPLTFAFNHRSNLYLHEFCLHFIIVFFF